ncbi:hypothetical protein BUALT_Bualt14G0067100 [Buddleja alternifolia]|uniref:UspA domain-containing protein n=1 Tax=Buddleja alternifolia TaxID=168488 RepID=A0AAV6WFK8_9LAMI|nr:hypothetical protein BUALT_Bualt14G0067100 [Buddleja alternifolia]
MADKQVMLIALDDSEHSYYALEWTLNQFFSHPSDANFKLIIIHAKIPPTSALGLAGPATNEILPIVTADLKETAERVMANAKETCNKRSVTAQYEIIEGDARNVMCDAVEKYHASVLVVGSHGYGAFKRAVLGSVSDYCSHHAHCSVMIVKKPKQKP